MLYTELYTLFLLFWIETHKHHLDLIIKICYKFVKLTGERVVVMKNRIAVCQLTAAGRRWFTGEADGRIDGK